MGALFSKIGYGASFFGFKMLGYCCPNWWWGDGGIILRMVIVVPLTIPRTINDPSSSRSTYH
jgi:hypothetical protein